MIIYQVQSRSGRQKELELLQTTDRARATTLPLPNCALRQAEQGTHIALRAILHIDSLSRRHPCWIHAFPQTAQAAFQKAKELLAQGDAETAVASLGDLIGFLPADDAGWSLRAGHVFGELVHFYASQGGVDQANELVETMLQRRIQVEQFVDAATLERLGRGGIEGVGVGGEGMAYQSGNGGQSWQSLGDGGAGFEDDDPF